MALWSKSSPRFFRFGAFEVDLWTGELRKNGNKLKVQEQPLKVLALLLTRPGELVSREQLREGLWSNDTFVDFDRGLNTAVKRLRDALCDSAENPRFVETVGSRGYRFIAPVSGGNSGTTETAVQPSPPGDVFEWPRDVDQKPPVDPTAADAAREPRPVRSISRRWIVVVVTLTSIVALGIAGYGIRRWKSNDSSQPDFQHLQLIRLTSNGKVEDVAISPDGRYVAYLFRDGENTSLRLRQVKEPGEAQVLVHDPLLFSGLTFSPDGSLIYFLRATPKDTLFRHLYEIPSLGGPEKKVTPNVDTAVSFSPDGSQFVYESGMPSKDAVEIRIANADGSGDRLLANITDAFAGYTPGAAWSPDGKSVAVPVWMHHQNPGTVLNVISVGTGAMRALYVGTLGLGRPRWLLNGKMLVVPVNDGNERTQLWTFSYPEGKIQRLTNDLADYDSDIDITRDGEMLATVQHTTIANLWVSSSRDGSSAEQLTSGQQFITHVFPVDGRLAIVNRANNEVWLIDPDGSRPQLVSSAVRGNWFTGCGRFILFSSDRDGSTELMRIDSGGTNALQLASGLIWGEDCSPDGRFVYYPEVFKPRWKIRRVPIDGGPPVDIFENPGEAMPGRIAISPDGKLLAFPYDVASNGPVLNIGTVMTDGGPLVKTFYVAGDFEGLRWSPDGRGLQYLQQKNGATNLWEQPFSGGPPHQLTKFTSGRIFDFHWSADRTQLYLCRGDITSDVVLLSHLQK